MLLAALVAAALQPSWGLAASKTQLQTAVTFTIFVLQGVMLRQGEAKKALGAAAAWTGAGWVAEAVLGGNTALALLLTIATNLASVFTLPFLLPWALKLVQCILLPTLLGAGVRGASEGLRSWVDANRRTLSVISGGLLSLVSKALAQGVTVAPAALAAAVAWSLAFHVVYLGLNCGAATLLRLGGSDPVAAAATRRALIIVASQKTLPVAMAVLGRLAPAVGAEAAGCAAVTAVFSHLAQTCVDFALVSRWLEHIQRRDIKANKAA
eukprot:XP_001694494.1 predicted protein [Chlamydomonas reinhardtii]